MKIIDVMTSNVEIALSTDTVEQAAQVMAEIGAGALPVGEDDRLVGMITDRDIAVRCVAGGFDPKSTKVSDIMSNAIKYCFVDQDVDHIISNMGEAYLLKGDLANAQAHLDALDKICLLGCAEYSALKQKVAEYKKNKTS